jgi:hypothetical protein
MPSSSLSRMRWRRAAPTTSPTSGAAQRSVSEDEAFRRTIEWERRNPPEAGSLPPLVAEPDYEAEDRALAALRLT